MSQPANFSIPQSGDAPVTPAAMFAAIEASLQAALSQHSGSATPAYADLGTVWCDTTTNLLYMNDGTSDFQIVLLVGVPASASATGTAGQWAQDADYIYVCTATDTWKRVAIATW